MTQDTISVAGSVRWIGASQAGRLLTQLAGMLVLARLLPPADYGLMAMAATVTTFASLLRDMGTGAALIHQPSLRAELVDSVFWFNAALGTGLTLLTLALAPLAALAYGEPRLSAILLWLAPTFALASLGTVQQALLERDSRFRPLAAVNVSAGVIGLLAALAAAWRGAGVFALVIQSIISTGLSTLMLWRINNWRPAGPARLSELKSLLGYSGNLFLFNLVNYLHRNADTMLIGRFLGPGPLGLYNVAYRLLMLPLQNVTFVVNKAVFPAYSRSQHNPDVLARHYVDSLRMIAFVTAPAMGLLWVAREPLIVVLLGRQWMQSAGVLAWLAPVGFMQSIVSTSGSVLMATGRTKTLRNLAFIGAPFLVLSFVAGLPWGINGVAAAYCMANVIWMFPVLHTVVHSLGHGLRPVLVAIIPPAILAGVAALCATGLLRLDVAGILHAPAKVALAAAIGALIYLPGALLLCRQTLIQFFRMLPIGSRN